MTTEHKIEGTDNLLMQTIRDQAADLEHGWREAIQNGIDSPGSTRVELDWNERMTVVRDDGAGVDLDTDAGLALLKNLGETSKKDDGDSIGQFGVGKGQVVAKGHAVFMSGTSALHYDVREWGLTVKQVPIPEDRAVDGLEVRVSHYKDEVPTASWRWNRYDERVRDRFKFTSMACDVDVVINEEVVSDNAPSEEVSSEYAVVAENPDDSVAKFTAAIEPSSTGEIRLYSNGIYIKDVKYNGVSGVVITHENLDLNFARNEVKSGCPIWKEVSGWLEAAVEDMLRSIPDSHLSDGARSFLAERSLSDGDIDPEQPMFKTVDGRRVSLNDVRDSSQISFADGSNHQARRLAQSWGMMILDHSDDATGRLEDAVNTMKSLKKDMPEMFDTQQKAKEVSLPETHEILDGTDLNTAQQRKLAVARELARRLGISRTVRWGESEVSDSWTDGFDEIILTNGAAPSRNKSAWIPQVFRALIKQSAARSDTRGEEPDGASYRRRYVEAMESGFDEMSVMVGEADRNGIDAALKARQ